MKHHLVVTLKPTRALPKGKKLTIEYPDRDTAEAELRCMERFRRSIWNAPEIYLETVDGEKWCLAHRAIAWPVLIAAGEPVTV